MNTTQPIIQPGLGARGRTSAGCTRPDRPDALGGPTMRLTRRGRIVVFVAFLGLTLTMLVLIGGPAVPTGEVYHPGSHTVVVRPGQSLWDIAHEVAPQSDPREVVAEIAQLNALSDPGAIRPGQPLDVPAS